MLDAFPSAQTREVEAGWEDRWRAFHRPVRVGPLWVGPPWESPPADAVAVVVDPGRAFGTGAHPTTRLCLDLLVAEERGSVLDVGCGSGVLAIAAAKLGHAPVVAVDVDPSAIAATGENAARNGVAVDVRLADTGTSFPTAKLALANIALDVVEALGSRLDVERLVTSGYLDTDVPSVSGYDHVERRELDGWAADVHGRR